MAQSFAVTGQQDFFKLAAKLKYAREVDLGKQLDKGVRRAAKHVEHAVREDAPRYLPKGYEPVFIASMVFTTSIRKSRDPSVTIRLRARGRRGHDRQVQNIERGLLRHPIFAKGPRSKWRWHEQHVRPRFFTQPANKALPKVRDEIQQAIHQVAQNIMEG